MAIASYFRKFVLGLMKMTHQVILILVVQAFGPCRWYSHTMHVCMHACMHVCVRARVHARARVCVRTGLDEDKAAGDLEFGCTGGLWTL